MAGQYQFQCIVGVSGFGPCMAFLYTTFINTKVEAHFLYIKEQL